MSRIFNSVIDVIRNQSKPVIFGNVRLNSTLAGASQLNLNELKTLKISSPKPFVYHVQFNRPDKFNSINKTMWIEIKESFESLSVNPDCRVIVISGEGKHFCAGIDLNDMISLGGKLATETDLVRKAKIINTNLKYYQDTLSSLEICSKPVIAATHSGCVGAGINLITAADIRLCTNDAFFQVKEIDLGMAADVGVLQRLPKIISSQGIAREICFTGRKVPSDEAKNIGLVNEVYSNRDDLINGAMKLAEIIAEKSPVAVQNTKKNMVYSLDHTNQEGLDHIREINVYALQSEDFANGVGGQISKEKPEFGKL